MLAYLGKFIPSSCSALSPFGEECRLVVTSQATEAFHIFERVDKQSSCPQYFGPKRPAVKLSVDASSKGLGAVLLQDNHPMAYASLFSQHVSKTMLKSRRKCLPLYLATKSFTVT